MVGWLYRVMIEVVFGCCGVKYCCCCFIGVGDWVGVVVKNGLFDMVVCGDC